MKEKIQEINKTNKKLIRKMENIKKKIIGQVANRKMIKLYINLSINIGNRKSVDIYFYFLTSKGKVYSSSNISEFYNFFNISFGYFEHFLKFYDDTIFNYKILNADIGRKISTGICFKIFFDNFKCKYSLEPFTLIKYRNLKNNQSYSIGYRKNISIDLINYNKKKYIYLLQTGRLKKIPSILDIEEYYILPDVSSLLLHEACGHFLEADMVILEQTPFSLESKGELITSKEINIDSENNGHYLGGNIFDDEGIECETGSLIKKGKIKEYMVDSTLATVTGNPLRGNCRCKNILNKNAHIRMTNFIVKNSKREISDEQGIYLSNVGGMTVYSNGDFKCIFNSFYYKNKKYNCKMLYTDNIKDFLKKITKVYNDQVAFTGKCYKGTRDKGETFIVTNAAPTIKVSNLFLKEIDKIAVGEMGEDFL